MAIRRDLTGIRGMDYLCSDQRGIMNTALLTITLAIGLLALGFAGIAVKIWAKKGGEFAGTCASNNPLMKEEGGGCGYCGARPEEKCRRNDVAA
jgi:hypothetical protein